MRSGISRDIPAAAIVRIDSRGSISGTVVLEGRTDWTMPSSDVRFFLRKGSMKAGATGAGQAGGFDTLTDSVFVAANDADTATPGIQKALPSTGAFSLTKVPAGDYTLVVFVERYLAAQTEVTVKPGEALTGIQPTRNGLGTDMGKLLAGDAAGYDHDGIAATNTRPDNFIDSKDESAITAAFLANSGDSLYTAYPYADVNGSGRVDGVDLNFAVVNKTTINGTNDPVKPTFDLKPAVPAGTNADAEFVLASLPGTVKAGETFDVEVRVNGAVAARAYEFHLGYDQSGLRPEGVVAVGDLLARYGVSMAARDLARSAGARRSSLVVVMPPRATGGRTMFPELSELTASPAAPPRIGKDTAM